MDSRGKYALRARLVEHEGNEQFPYKDSLRNWSIGIGHNLSEHGLTQAQIERIFEDDLLLAEQDADKYFHWYQTLNSARQTVIAELIFNMGIRRVLTFKKMLEAMRLQQFEKASDELIDSKWYGQVGKERGDHLATVLKFGTY